MNRLTRRTVRAKAHRRRTRAIPRAHSEPQIAQLADSIETMGFTLPILVDENHYILAGYGKLLGAPGPQRAGRAKLFPAETVESLTKKDTQK